MDLILLFISKYLLGYLLQSISCVLVVYAFNKKKIEIKMFSTLTIIFAVSIFLIRSLQIAFGYHMLLILFVLAIVCILILKIPIRTTVFAVLFVGIAIVIFEIVTGLIFGAFLGFNNTVALANLTSTELNKAVNGIPSVVLFFATSLIVYAKMLKENYKS